MIVTVHPSSVKGTVRAPASKSSMQRACAAALLCKGTSQILQPGSSNDDRAALDVIQKLGARVRENRDGSFTVDSNGVNPVSAEINCGESGLGIRMFTPIAALSKQEITITGTGSLVTRPMHFFEEVLPQAGVQIRSHGGKLPLSVQGPLIPSPIEVDGSLSSQFLTGLLMAYGAAGATGPLIRVNNLTSKPYIDLTLDVMRRFGVQVEHEDYQVFNVRSSTGYTPATYTVEGDWSGGAFLLVAGAVAGEIVVQGLDAASTQADKAILLALKDCGARLDVDNNRIVSGPASLQSFRFDATDCPDLFPPLVALAAYCNGTTEITGASRLTHKESNRALTLQEEFGKMGIAIELEGDLMKIHGGKPLKSATVHSNHDHRIAMACAVAALGAGGKIIIEEAQAVNKSYPQFYQHLAGLGVNVQNIQSEQQTT
ncbi:MAG: 3-phosphoshikimate 1-carboxyvinyltransferase [Williamsia sp.]|nr:3-phosphoshikimate 1-carboxyvinyltransferase [Williamsia sp.]